jgi:transcriptional regulator with XRE-family HTH domain
MLTLDQIRSLLTDRRLDVVAKATNVHRNTIAAIRDGKNTNPTHTVLMRLSDYLTGAGCA